MLVLLLLVLCVCFHVACVMYLHLTSVQVGLSDLPQQGAAPLKLVEDLLLFPLCHFLTSCRLH